MNSPIVIASKRGQKEDSFYDCSARPRFHTTKTHSRTRWRAVPS